MLEHHADTYAPRLGRRFDMHFAVLPQHLAGVGPGHTVDDLHQRALARAVFPQHRMDLTGAHDQIDLLIRHHRRVYFGDAAQFQTRVGELYVHGRRLSIAS